MKLILKIIKILAILCYLIKIVSQMKYLFTCKSNCSHSSIKLYFNCTAGLSSSQFISKNSFMVQRFYCQLFNTDKYFIKLYLNIVKLY